MDAYGHVFSLLMASLLIDSFKHDTPIFSNLTCYSWKAGDFGVNNLFLTIKIVDSYPAIKIWIDLSNPQLVS